LFIKNFSFSTIFSVRRLFSATKHLSLRDKLITALFLIIIAGALVWFGMSLFSYFTKLVPAQGGQYTEAIVGQPRLLNPLLNRSSPLVKLIYSSLFSYDKDGKLVPDLAEKYEVSDDNKEFTIFLKQDIKWHDDEPLKADDILFTINLIKNIDYGAAGVSTELRVAFADVKVEKEDDFKIKFILNEPQADFLHNLTIGILPQHAWEKIGPDKFQLSKLNKSPIGTGPFELVKFDEEADGEYISSYTLRSYKNYHQGEPYITKAVFKFYPDRDSAISAYNNGEVMAVTTDKNEHIDLLNKKGINKKVLILPHYFAVFFNQNKSVPLAFDEVRLALAMATNRNEIIEQVFNQMAVPMRSPMMEGMAGYSDKYQQKDFNIEEANKLLDEKGWKREDDGIRKKDDDRLEFELHIDSNRVMSLEIAKILEKQWKEIGAELKIIEHNKNDLEVNIIRSRDYDALLYAHLSRFSNPDFMPLWHSKERDDPGINYAGMNDEALDKILEKLKEEEKEDKRIELYEKFQEQIQSEDPAVFLFSPGFTFIYDDNLKGVSAERVNNVNDRYADIQSWYLKEKYVKK
jgi:peptide/nickel transport system substrate-binding protein